MKRSWIKLYLEILDDSEFGELSEFIKWRAIELFLVAGENGDDGLLPPVKRLAWRLRLDDVKIAETLSALTQAGVVHETPEGWVVTHFSKRQEPMSTAARVKEYRNRKDVTKRYKECNENVTGEENDSSSTSSSVSNSYSLEEGYGEKPIPGTPAEAMDNPDIVVYSEVSGRVPGVSQYKAVIDTVGYLRKVKNLTYETAITYLMPYWLAWSNRKTRDGRPYDPGNLSWLTEWAVNASIPAVVSVSNKPKSAYAQLQELQKENENGS